MSRNFSLEQERLEEVLVDNDKLQEKLDSLRGQIKDLQLLAASRIANIPNSVIFYCRECAAGCIGNENIEHTPECLVARILEIK